MLPMVKRLGSRETPRRGRRWRVCGGSDARRKKRSRPPSGWLSTSRSVAPLGTQDGDDGFASTHRCTDVHGNCGIVRYEHIHARAELHDAETLPRTNFVAASEPAHDAPRQHADDLTRHDRLAVVIDPDLAALIHTSRVMTIRGKKPSRRHGHTRHAA